MSGKIESSDQILKNPLNDSTAKYNWSFSKASRFSEPKSYNKTICYDLPSGKSNRRAGIGFGNRSTIFDGTSKKDMPPPGLYESPSDFTNNKDKKGFSFGYNRNQLKYANYLRQNENNPSPLNYEITQNLVKSSRSYSLRPKTSYPKDYFLPNEYEKNRLKQLPGPGKYENVDMLGSNKDFYTSKHTNYKSRSFRGGDRFHADGKQCPGPADYLNNTFSPDGIYLLSNMKSSGRRAILNQKRQLSLVGNKETPGPGQYQKPSDFGHYDVPSKSGYRPKTAR